MSDKTGVPDTRPVDHSDLQERADLIEELGYVPADINEALEAKKNESKKASAQKGKDDE